MFKELWRKFGSDFLQATCVEEELALPAENTHSADKHVRVLPHITHTGEFHLERLTQLLKSRYGRNFTVPADTTSSDRALKEVITLASRIQDQDIQRELLLFYLNCSPVIQEHLRSETPLGQGSFIGQ